MTFLPPRRMERGRKMGSDPLPGWPTVADVIFWEHSSPLGDGWRVRAECAYDPEQDKRSYAASRLEEAAKEVEGAGDRGIADFVREMAKAEREGGRCQP
jgi:hypothetical protein